MKELDVIAQTLELLGEDQLAASVDSLRTAGTMCYIECFTETPQELQKRLQREDSFDIYEDRLEDLTISPAGDYGSWTIQTWWPSFANITSKHLVVGKREMLVVFRDGKKALQKAKGLKNATLPDISDLPRKKIFRKLELTPEQEARYKQYQLIKDAKDASELLNHLLHNMQLALKDKRVNSFWGGEA